MDFHDFRLSLRGGKEIPKQTSTGGHAIGCSKQHIPPYFDDDVPPALMNPAEKSAAAIIR
jgi:hypothetical protein